MPYEQMDEQQVAAYLHMDAREVVKLCCRGQIPCRKVGGRFVFMKAEVDHWVEAQMHRMDKRRLADIEKGVSAHHGFDPSEPLVWPLIPEGGLAVPLPAKTRDAAIRALVDLADNAALVYSRDRLIEGVQSREKLCSTALLPSTAIPHPRHPLPNDIAASFVVAGLTPSGLPYSAEDGSLTRLFFLICCKDERTHLHVLARLGGMLQQHGAIEDLLACEDVEEFGRRLLRLEQSVLEVRGSDFASRLGT